MTQNEMPQGQNELEARTVERAIGRLLTQDVRNAAKAVLTGELDAAACIGAMFAKLTQVSKMLKEHGAPTNVEQLQVIVPAPPASGGFQRVSDDVVRQVLAMRRAGASRRRIALMLGKPPQTVAAILRREGDPAPDDQRAREMRTKERTIARLTAQLEAAKAKVRKSG